MQLSAIEKLSSKGLMNLLRKALETLLSVWGVEFFLVLGVPSDRHTARDAADKAYAVKVMASRNLQDLEVHQHLDWRVPQIIRSSKHQAALAAQVRVPFTHLPKQFTCNIVKEVLTAAMHNRAKDFAWGDSTAGCLEKSEKAAAEYAWFPAAIPWRNPDHWTEAELLQLLEAVCTHYSDIEYDKLQRKLNIKLTAQNYNAASRAEVKAAFQQLRSSCRGSAGPARQAAEQRGATGAGTMVDIDLDTGGGHSLTKVDGVTYLGPTVSHAGMLEVLKRSDFGSKIKERNIITVRGVDVHLVHLYNSFQRHGLTTFPQVHSTKAQDRALLQSVADDLFVEKVGDWRKALHRAWNKYILPFVESERGRPETSDDEADGNGKDAARGHGTTHHSGSSTSGSEDDAEAVAAILTADGGNSDAESDLLVHVPQADAGADAGVPAGQPADPAAAHAGAPVEPRDGAAAASFLVETTEGGPSMMAMLQGMQPPAALQAAGIGDAAPVTASNDGCAATAADAASQDHSVQQLRRVVPPRGSKRPRGGAEPHHDSGAKRQQPIPVVPPMPPLLPPPSTQRPTSALTAAVSNTGLYAAAGPVAAVDTTATRRSARGQAPRPSRFAE